MKFLNFITHRRMFSFTLLITSITLGVMLILLATGYSYNSDKKQIIKTGIIKANSIPDGASVYINNKLTAATNSSISGLEPGDYDIKISKKGYSNWIKTVNVTAEFVTQIEALLIPSAPELKPASFDGITKLLKSPDNSRALLILSNPEKNGIWVLSFNSMPFGAFGTGYSIKQIVKDSSTVKFSQADLIWSNDSQTILASISEKDKTINYLLDSERLNENPNLSTETKETILNKWKQEEENLITQKKKGLNSEELSIYEEATNPIWSPDDLQFLFLQNSEYFTYSLEDKKTTRVENIDPKNILSIEWYPDSNHLIVIENYTEQKNGKISILEVDGSNKTSAYEGLLTSPQIIISTDGRKVFLLTSFNLTEGISSLYYFNLH